MCGKFIPINKGHWVFFLIKTKNMWVREENLLFYLAD